MIPILRRELLAILRTPWMMPTIVAAAACFAALVLWRWPAAGLVFTVANTLIMKRQ